MRPVAHPSTPRLARLLGRGYDHNVQPPSMTVGDAGGEGALVAGQIERERGDFFRGAETAHRLARDEHVPPVGPAAAARSSIEGVSMVPGQMQLQRMPLPTKSAATARVSAATAALVAA